MTHYLPIVSDWVVVHTIQGQCRSEDILADFLWTRLVGARWAVFGDKRGVGSDQNKWGWGDQGGSDMVD